MKIERLAGISAALRQITADGDGKHYEEVPLLSRILAQESGRMSEQQIHELWMRVRQLEAEEPDPSA